MSAFGFHDGQRATNRVVLSGTSATTLLDAADRRFHVLGIKLVNHSGGALTPVIDFYDGTTATILRDNKSLSDTADEIVEFPGDFGVMDLGDKLRITANSNLSVWVSYIDPAKQTGTHA